MSANIAIVGKRVAAVLAAAALMGGAVGVVGASAATGGASEQAGQAASEQAAGDYAEGSVKANHAALGVDLAGVTEVSIEQCSPCHGGSWEAIQETTVDMWEGVGQISDANPHEAHATNGYVCSSCHKLTEGPSVQQCNGCHAFGVPEGWLEKDPTTTAYGLVADEPLY